PSSSVCWGIEVGAAAVKAIKLELGSDGPRVVDYAIIPHARVLSEPEVDQEEAKRIALNRLVNEHDLTGATIAVSVPGHSAFARFAKLPPVEQKKVPQIVKFEAVQQIPFPLEDVEWDYQTFQDPESPDVEVGIFAVTKERVADDLALLKEVGITPDIVTLSPAAVYNAIAYDLEFTEKTPGTVLLDVGTTATDLIIADSGRVWVRTFPLGGHEFTQALVEAFKLSYPKAEKLKRDAEQSKHARHVFQALRPVFSDLAQDIQRSIGYYQSLHRDADLSRLIGVGSTFQLPGMRKYLKQQLDLNVYRLERFKRLPVEGPHAAEFDALAPMLTTVAGLALQGLGQAALNANVIPVNVVRDAMWRRKTKWFATAAGLGLVAAGSLFIGPFLSQTKLEAVTPPAEIDRAITLGSRLTNEANEAGVTSPMDNNFAAANVIDLFDQKEVFGWLASDASSMIESGSSHSYELVSMTTEYRYGSGDASSTSTRGAAEPDFGFDEPQSVGRGGRGSRGMADPRDSRGGGRDPLEQERSRGGGEPEKGEPRVAVELTIQSDVARENLDEVITASVVKWLRENASRSDAPYTLRTESGGSAWSMVEGPGDGTGGNRISNNSVRQPGGVRTPSRRGQVDIRDQEAVNRMLEEQDRQDRMSGNLIGGRGPTPAQQRNQNNLSGSADLDQIAPIEKPEESSAGSTFTIRFDAVLKWNPASNGGGA
ncbi:MAG: type IV pilus assembly protein PilM, partial [Salinibacterium sp.]|nr:type IV pilus assembly protein PilM [Salinibacterium sp.]